MPVQDRLARLARCPASLAGEHGEQFAKGLHRQDYLLLDEARQYSGGARFAVRAIDTFGIGQDVGIEGNPHASAFIERIAAPPAHISHLLLGKALK